MDGHIGRLHCRYRSITDAPAAAQFAARLNRVVEERLPHALGDALDRALGEDPSVYILQSLQCELFFNAEVNTDDAQVARDWAERIAASVTRAIRGAGGGSNIVRF